MEFPSLTPSNQGPRSKNTVACLALGDFQISTYVKLDHWAAQGYQQMHSHKIQISLPALPQLVAFPAKKCDGTASTRSAVHLLQRM